MEDFEKPIALVIYTYTISLLQVMSPVSCMSSTLRESKLRKIGYIVYVDMTPIAPEER